METEQKNIMTERKIREYQSTKVLVRLRQLIDHNGGDARKTSRQLGYSDGAAKAWLDRGDMPVVADLACEGLLRRLGGSLRKTELVVAKGTSAEMAAFRPVADALKATLVDAMADATGSIFIMQVPSEVCETLGLVATRMGCSYKKVQVV